MEVLRHHIFYSVSMIVKV